jgi:hypothetical protein
VTLEERLTLKGPAGVAPPSMFPPRLTRAPLGGGRAPAPPPAPAEQADVVTSLAFTPDGRTLVSGSRGGVVTVWEAAFPQS